jgi:glycosyltransferase involved in cell wall biosynthesis
MGDPAVIRSRIRVVHIASQLDIGGMEKLLVEFARHADRGRFELRFISLGTRGRLAGEIEACGWSVVALEEPPGMRWGLVLRLARLLRRWGVDVVHAHNTKPLIYGGPAARLARVNRVVYTRHGQRRNARRMENVLFRLAIRTVDRAACVSHDAARLSARDGIHPGKIATIWNGIDVERFGCLGPQTGGPAVMIGRLSPEKDVATLLRATAIVARECPTFRLEIAGDGRCLPDLRRLADELALGEQVRFLGEVDDVPSVLSRAYLFVLPSLTEGLSLTLLEAMARGLPVLTTRVGGNPEVVVDGQTGLLIPPGDPPAMARAILRLLRDPAGTSRMGLAGRRRVEHHFEIRRMIADYEALYLRMLGREVPAGCAAESISLKEAP